MELRAFAADELTLASRRPLDNLPALNLQVAGYVGSAGNQRNIWRKKKSSIPTGRNRSQLIPRGMSIGGWLFISGQGPLDLKAGKVVPGSIEEQTRLAQASVGKILEATGCNFADVKCGGYLADMQ